MLLDNRLCLTSLEPPARCPPPVGRIRGRRIDRQRTPATGSATPWSQRYSFRVVPVCCRTGAQDDRAPSSPGRRWLLLHCRGHVGLIGTTVWDQTSCHEAKAFHVLYASSPQAEQLPEKNGPLYRDEKVVGRIAWVLAVPHFSWSFRRVPVAFLRRPAARAFHRLFGVERVSNAVQMKAVPARQDSDRARKFLLERSYICEGIHLDGIKTHRAFKLPFYST